jgi:CRP-like cAMP-binding protein
LEPSLREEIIDAFTDIRIAPGTEVIKQNDVGDNFYIVDVGEFEVVKQEVRV